MTTEAGPEKDEKVAKLLGWEWKGWDARDVNAGWWVLPDGKGGFKRRMSTADDTPPPFSSDIREAWDVVEAMRDAGWLVVIKEIPNGFPYIYKDDETRVYKRVSCNLEWLPLRSHAHMRMASKHYQAFGDNASDAICSVFLEMMEREAALSTAR